MGRPLLIGLTGGIAAGKSEALAALERLGAATISSDAVVHELLGDAELRERLAARWGEGVLSDGEVDRRRVGEIVFESPGELAWLEAELHPRVGRRIADWRESLPAGTEVAVVEVPLLFETAMEDAFDTTVAVVADDGVRRKRAEARGHAFVEERAARQLEQEQKASRADHVVRNDGTIAELERKLAELLDRLPAARPGAGGDPLQR